MTQQIRGNLDSRIASAKEAIRDSVQFGVAYGLDGCFRSKVNSLYNEIISGNQNWSAERIESRTIKELDKIIPRAAFIVWRERLEEAQTFYEQCLQQAEAQRLSQSENQQGSSNGTAFLDPEVGESSPFDRRLERLLITENSDGPYPIMPYDTRYRDAGTIGFTMSEKMVRDSQVEGKDRIAQGIAISRAQMANDPFYVGVPSVVNNYAITKLYGSNGGEYLVDKRGERKWYEIDTTQEGRLNYSSTPTTTSIINWGKGDPYGRTPFSFSDFIFCKYWGKIPNNRLITLRRYPAPILDNLRFPGMDGFTSPGNPDPKSSDGAEDSLTGETVFEGEVGTPIRSGDDQGSGKKIEFPPMATALTFFGEETGNNLSDLLKFTTGFNWGDVESDVFKVGTESNPDMEAGPGGLFGGMTSMARMLNIATGNFDQNAMLNQGNLPPDPYDGGPYENRIIGPVNAITSVKKRERGIQYENKISLTFHYIARPVGGINTKAALLDIISNFLVIGSATAMFWGGQHRFMGQPQRYPFLGGDKGIQQWYRGDPLGWGQTSMESFASKVVGSGGLIDMTKNFFSTLLGGGGSGDNDIMGGMKNLLSGDNVAGNIIRAKAAERSNGQIPYLTGLRALLIGEPVGEWHLTIGNPLNPIAMIGNLICNNIEVEFSDELGPDDFPLGVKVVVNLEHGMARDRDAIQSMFNRGMGRIYELPDNFVGSADYETKVDDVTGNASKTGRSPADWRSGTVIGGAATTGGATGPSKVTENSNQGNTSVWNRAAFASVAPNQTISFANPNNIRARSEFRAASWVSLKTMK